ncbi:hypothetical protein ACJJTC_000322 [Scirpophaga incertulas]
MLDEEQSSRALRSGSSSAGGSTKGLRKSGPVSNTSGPRTTASRASSADSTTAGSKRRMEDSESSGASVESVVSMASVRTEKASDADGRSGRKGSPSGYRPIVLLDEVGKVFERLIASSSSSRRSQPVAGSLRLQGGSVDPRRTVRPAGGSQGGV